MATIFNARAATVTAFLGAAVLAAAIGAADATEPTGSRAALPGIIGKDDRVLLEPDVWPWTALGRINREGGGFCTGALVAPDLVLTAAHCLVDPRTGRPAAAKRMHFLAGYRRGSYAAHATAREIVTPPGEDAEGKTPQGLAHDWAILVLTNPMTIPPLPVRAFGEGDAAALRDGRARLMCAGYGRDRAHLLSLHDGCTVTGRTAGDALLLHTCDATQGESGSPLLLQTDDGPVIVGVTIGMTRIDGVERGVAVHARGFTVPLALLRER